ncbi:MAG TPA: hypothetical protein VFD69_02040 [Vicinamibacterales bacterium]|nr:hypothetical protein [Vicinamibacterales bacterium]
MIDDQVGGHALTAVTGADFNAPPVDRRDQGKQVQKDPVFFELRVNPKPDVFQRWQLFFATCSQHAVLLHEKFLRHGLARPKGRSELQFKLIDPGPNEPSEKSAGKALHVLSLLSTVNAIVRSHKSNIAATLILLWMPRGIRTGSDWKFGEAETSCRASTTTLCQKLWRIVEPIC